MIDHLRRYPGAFRHFARNRGLEVVALQASPLLGLLLGATERRAIDFIQMGFLLTGSLALTAHVFVFNDWAGQHTDLLDERRAPVGFVRRGIKSRDVVILSVALLMVAFAMFAIVSPAAVLYGVAIATLSTVYSYFVGKTTPIMSSVIHLLGGGCHFLLGYTVTHHIDSRGIAIASFFALVFAAGHLNQEVRDHDGDLQNLIRTNAVVFGRRRAFVTSVVLFTAAYATITGLAALTIIPRPLMWAVTLWPLHVAWSVRAIRRGLSFESALWMQRRYRVLFAGLGLAILLTASTATQPIRLTPGQHADRPAIRASLGSTAHLTGESAVARQPTQIPQVQ